MRKHEPYFEPIPQPPALLAPFELIPAPPLLESESESESESEYFPPLSIKSGPQFGSKDIFIGYTCNIKDSCWISLTNTFNCHPHYKSSLFVNTAGPNEMNYFEMLDYEVYAYNQPVKLSNN